MIKVDFYDENVWNDFIKIKKKNKIMFDKINQLITNIKIDPRSGIGKPERLKHADGEVWSQRIDQKNRLVYEIADEYTVVITDIKSHYSDH